MTKRTISHAGSVHAVDDDIIAIVADGGHGADAAKTENGSGSGVELTEERSKVPDSTIKTVVNEYRKLSYHHADIGESQIDDKHVGRSFQILGFRKKMQNQSIS